MKKLVFLLAAILPIISTGQNLELNLQSGHNGIIDDAVFSPDGKYLATSSWDATIIIWDARSGLQLRQFSAEGHTPKHLLFDPEGKYLISGGLEGKIAIWDHFEGKLMRKVPLVSRKSIEDLDWSIPGKEVLVTQSSIVFGKGYITFLDLETAKANKFFEYPANCLESAAIDAQRKYLAVGESGSMGELFDGLRRAVVFDLETMDTLLISHQKFNIDHLEFSADSRYLCIEPERVAGHKDTMPELQFWDILEKKEKIEWRIKVEGINGTSFDSEGKYFLVGISKKDDKRGYVQLWDAQSHTMIKEIITHANSMFCFSAQTGVFIAISKFYRLMEMYSYPDCRKMLDMSNKMRTVRCLDVSANGRWLASGSQSAFDQTTKIWDLKTGRVAKRLKGHKYYIYDLEFSPSGNLIATGSKDKISVWNTSDWSLVYSDTVESRCLTWYSDSVFVIGDYDGTIHIVRPQLDSLVSFSTGTKKLSHLSAINGKVSMRAEDGLVVIWDLQRQSLESVTIGKASQKALWFNDSTLLADGVYQLYSININSGRITEYEDPDIQGACLVLSHDKKFAVMGSGSSLSSDGELRVWDLSTMQVVRSLKGHNNNITDMVFSVDGSKLFSASSDGIIRIWDWASGKEELMLIGNEKEFISLTPEGNYSMSKNGHQFVTFREGDKLYSFNQLDLLYNRPDKVVERLDPDNHALIDNFKQAHTKRLKSLGIKPGASQYAIDLPTCNVEILNAKKIYEEAVNINVQASVKNTNLQAIRIWINGVEINRPAFVSGKSKALNRNIALPLIQGQNKVEISALSTLGVESLPLTFYFTCEKNNIKRNLYILCLSVSSYQDSTYNLKYAAKDGRDLVQQFSQSEKGLFSTENFERIIVDTLIDGAALKSNLAKWEALLANASIEDQVLLFVSGHGLLGSDNEFYFASHDVEFSKPEEKGIPFSALDELLSNAPPLKKLLLMDACHSGLLDPDAVQETVLVKLDTDGNPAGSRGTPLISFEDDESESTSFELMQELFVNLNRGSGAQVISASAGDSYALESPQWKNGIFTYCILKGLQNQEADLNEDGEIRIQELSTYVSEKVEALTDGRQKPGNRQENLEFDWRVW